MLIKNKTCGGVYYFKDIDEYSMIAEFDDEISNACSGSKKALQAIIEKIHSGKYKVVSKKGAQLFRYNTKLCDNKGREYIV